MGASDGIGYCVGVQHATARMVGKPGTIPFHLRVTEVFRRESGEWKLVHRHADPLAAKSEEKRAQSPTADPDA
jgi:ketosteroid isomerase-like protein